MKPVTKNFLKGSLLTIYTVAVTVIVPYVTLSYFRQIQVATVEIQYFQEGWDQMVAWIWRLGLLVSGLAFFRNTSPKGSKRWAWLAFLQTFANIAYIYMFRYGGATEVLLLYEGGYALIDVATIVYLLMGQMLLYTIINIFDIIYNTWFFKDKKEREYEKALEEIEKARKQAQIETKVEEPDLGRLDLPAGTEDIELASLPTGPEHGAGMSSPPPSATPGPTAATAPITSSAPVSPVDPTLSSHPPPETGTPVAQTPVPEPESPPVAAPAPSTSPTKSPKELRKDLKELLKEGDKLLKNKDMIGALEKYTTAGQLVQDLDDKKWHEAVQKRLDYMRNMQREDAK